MKTIYTLLFFFLVTINIHAQSGVVKYESRNVNIEHFKMEFRLLFNKNKSLAISDAKPFVGKRINNRQISSKGQYNAFYMDTQTKEGLVYKKRYGKKKKMYKTVSPITAKKWTIHQEFKTIAGYKVQKATLSYDYAVRSYQQKYESLNRGSITVWFAPSIPVNAGPQVSGNSNHDYVLWGLPGLILEFRFEGSNYITQAIEVTLSKEEIPLDIPNKENAIEFSNEKFWNKF